jgi:hypothetical protein
MSAHQEALFQLNNIATALPKRQERKQFNEKFVRMETQRLCHLTSAADALEIQPLVDIASRALARVMEVHTALRGWEERVCVCMCICGLGEKGRGRGLCLTRVRRYIPIFQGKSAEEIREAFHLADDLTEEEKLEPLTNTKDDPRIRLLNRLYAKKRKELAERKASKAAAQVRLVMHLSPLRILTSCFLLSCVLSPLSICDEFPFSLMFWLDLCLC